VPVTTSAGRRDRKKLQTRTALTVAALRLVDERGLDRVTVEDISEAADVSPRTFFNYFATKDDALVGDPLADGLEAGAALLAVPRDVPVIGAMLFVLTPAIEQMQADRELWLTRLRVIANNPTLLPALFARNAAVESELVEAIGRRTGLDPAVSGYPLLAAATCGAAFRTAMMRWAVARDGRPLIDFAQEAFGLLAAGLHEPAPQP
jgi:AcrR family transcriptional regulator